MKKLRSVLVGVSMIVPAVVVITAPLTTSPGQVEAAQKKKTRTSVTGAGKTKFEAENNAARAARQINSSYRRISSNTAGSDKTWVCTLVIEYTE